MRCSAIKSFDPTNMKSYLLFFSSLRFHWYKKSLFIECYVTLCKKDEFNSRKTLWLCIYLDLIEETHIEDIPAIDELFVELCTNIQ